MTFHRILLLNRNRIGDCLFTTPAIRALRRAFPESVLVTTVPPANHDLLASNPCLSELLIRPEVGISAELSLLTEVRRRRFDLVISFQEKSYFHAVLARLSGARLTVSLQNWRTQLLYDRVVPVVPGRHEVEKYLAIVEAALLPSIRARPDWCSDRVGGSLRSMTVSQPGALELHVSREHRARAEALLSDQRIHDESLLIGINPGATQEVKRWPVERFATLGRELASRYNAYILVLGGPGDEERAEAITQAVPRAFSSAGHARLGETAALLRRCHLLISGDTGPLHMAVALGVPTVGLFGPTNPVKYGPWISRGADRLSAAVLRHSEPCVHCPRPCVHTISVDECLAAVERSLALRTFVGAAV